MQEIHPLKYTPEEILSEIMYSSYVHQRKTHPEIAPRKWKAMYINQEEFEKRYQKEKGKNNE